MKFFITLFIAITLFSYSPLQAQAAEHMSEAAKTSLNNGLDAIEAQKWSDAVTYFKDVIDTAKDDAYLHYDYSDDSYQDFRDMVPSYVFYNLALASDKFGQQPLTTAFYYHAYLAYDPETDKRRTIEKRIGELEKEHLQYIYPLCSAAEARMGMVSYTAMGEPVPQYCIMALTLVGDVDHAKEIEKRYRKGFFSYLRGSCAFADPGYLDIGYATAYHELGKDRDFKRYEARVNDLKNTDNPKCDYSHRLQHFKKEMEMVGERRSAWEERLGHTDWTGGNTAQAIDFVYETNETKYDPTQAGLAEGVCLYHSPYVKNFLPNPLVNIGAYMALKDFDPHTNKIVEDAGTGLGPSEQIAQHNTCSAAVMALYWARYERTLKLWKKRTGKRMGVSDRKSTVNKRGSFND